MYCSLTLSSRLLTYSSNCQYNLYTKPLYHCGNTQRIALGAQVAKPHFWKEIKLNTGHWNLVIMFKLNKQSNGMRVLVARGQSLSEHTCTVHVGQSNKTPLLDILIGVLFLSAPCAFHYHLQVAKSSRKKSDCRDECRADAHGNEGDAPVSSSRLPDKTFTFDVSLPCSQPYNFRLDGIRTLPISAPCMWSYRWKNFREVGKTLKRKSLTFCGKIKNTWTACLLNMKQQQQLQEVKLVQERRGKWLTVTTAAHVDVLKTNWVLSSFVCNWRPFLKNFICRPGCSSVPDDRKTRPNASTFQSAVHKTKLMNILRQ